MMNVDMILLEDSDLYAVINCLKFKSVMNVVSKILIQESIMQTFMWYCKKYFKYDFVELKTFQSLKDLLTLNDISICKSDTVNIVSIWSEDIIAAKNLAESLKHNVLCINTCMDFEPGLILPYLELNKKSLDHSLHLYEVREYTCANPRNLITHQSVKYDLFYDGKWQTPVRKQYWMHNNILFANATREDIVECTTSARDGFKIWSTMSNQSRRQILCNFAFTLESESKPQFVHTIRDMIYFSYICENQMNFSIINNNVEVTLIYKPQGTAILQEKDELSLLKELTLNLAFGNSVIVICNPDLYFLAQFCNVFKMCGIPPGVINLLSMENADFEYDIISDTQLSKIYSGISVIQYMIAAC
ncbi:uncharacterized protein LOC114944596 [Nylanderia fulva]|uniref:uncharacterized protein LOC114944596 n=1 Tax=Nylanderia fulva TaxID=613905 RepID=UPI0010FAF87C|nr:uncharacterized protein LOC114944596 [Nylanderia fulva]